MKLQVSVKATDLQNVAGAFKGTSDPFAVLTLLAKDRNSKPVILGKTEVVKNSLDADWATTFFVDFELGQPANILVKIFDKVSEGDNKSMGSCLFNIGATLGAKGNTKAKKIQDDGGKIYLRVEKAKEFGFLRLKMAGEELANLDGWFNKSDPFYQFRKKDQGFRGSEWNIVHKSEYIKDNLDPEWDEAQIDLGALCGGDHDQILYLDLYDNESSGEHELMGQIETSVNGLLESDGFTLMKDGEETGRLIVQEAELLDEDGNPISEDEEETPAGEVPTEWTSNKASFTDYILGGCEINMCVAIDFTGSNGDPRQPGTLHHFNSDGSKNDYEKAVAAICGVLAQYDSDKKFPVYGFGAKYDGEVNHCFQCGEEEEADGVEGILEAYKHTFQTGLIMSSPTVVTTVLEKAAEAAVQSQAAAASQGKQKYTTLVILTDGAVSDVQATAECLAAISFAPLSVVIVGIGSADFGSMQFLDDSGPSGIDISQFVDFNAHQHDWKSLTSATLDEIPKQLVNYFWSRGIKPNHPDQVEEEDIVVEPEEEEIDLTIDFGEDGGDIVVPEGDVYIPPGAY